MKKLILLPLLFLAFLSVSCEKDESLDPLPTKEIGQFMRLDITTDRLNFNDVNNTAFGGHLTNPSGTVVRYEMFIRRTNAAGVITGDYVPFLTVNSFPYELAITPAMIATSLGLTVADLENGDFYRFIAYSYDAAGNKVGYGNLSRTVQTTKALKQGYRFNTILTDNLTAVVNNYTP